MGEAATLAWRGGGAGERSDGAAIGGGGGTGGGRWDPVRVGEREKTTFSVRSTQNSPNSIS